MQHAMKTITSKIDIEASPMVVWNVLVNLGGYSEWNPLLREGEGTVAVGNRRTHRDHQRQSLRRKPSSA